MSIEVLILLIAFQIKHLLADYYWQFPYMYENKGKKEGWFMPLLDHASVHATLTIIIVGLFMLTSKLLPFWVFASIVIFDLTTHFVTDRWKATRGRHPAESKFWTDLGIDQMIHHSVGIAIVYMMTT